MGGVALSGVHFLRLCAYMSMRPTPNTWLLLEFWRRMRVATSCPCQDVIGGTGICHTLAAHLWLDGLGIRTTFNSRQQR